ncbi:MAG: ABC1 kinase family protein [Pseudanabaena sp.]|jgi:predicted unusual protein kinase regulating ubiquinone biosynthesis (AarF/ABC1/UbiB family)|nr:AarF/ABC1/UbiB kinase family protein [Pseudanabaena sp. M53BS1SP1A06MG]MCA6583173.1 AarF/ABC1/UbiB kinase family protein [Pseudanabaena sp. M34BS1SP1A06MG]MCA6585733.1 AarF/ABC1/UbiB kinase family protein [Pseudanabaena sp. M051S1SP1A06QC]MCA6594302.1 AarF/ABC1/UbiB kinase family protein [Pseudanabaena sp. M38BS1SP1A06MG]MCA6598230.1 AarF/ABC1/UbiB kinase family protein [Pseudanabaena sp. M046S1SP1A06QC]MCA6602607.1 AarF/ABC1/UbiB kinase family protein [Pseudanabaena sp. M57BS1SP1A06MG]MCA
MSNPKSDFELDRYDIEAIANYYRNQPLRVWWRCVVIFVPLIWLFLRLRLNSKASADKLRKLAIESRQLLTQLGPAFIKIGQALSTRPDIVPPIFMDELAELQDQLPAFDNDIAFQFIREALGADPSEVYAEISENPIAAASLGQVYKGRLRTGELVAIKVQRPDIAAGIALDMYILRGIATWLRKTFKFVRSNLAAILDEFASRIFEEMDYTFEGHNAEKFAKYYGELEGIYVPKIYWQYTAKRVLTMEWIEGIKLTNVQKVKEAGFDSRHIIEVGVQCSLRQLLDYGYFHADPHPGNLLVMEDGKLAYLDFGMMSEVSSEQRFGLIEAIVHLVNRDFAALSKDYVRLGFLTEDIDFSAIVPALSEVFNPPEGQSLTQMDFKDMTDQLSQIMYDYPFQVPAYYALIIRSLVTLEGIAFSVDRNFKVLAVAYPYVANRLLTDPAPELRMALKDLLFRDGEFRWNRLENLLSNAQTNPDYNLNGTLDKGIDFLLSERSEFIHDRIIDEIVKGIEVEASKRLPERLRTSLIGDIVVDTQVKEGITKTEPPSSLGYIARLWSILQKDKAITPNEILPLATRILSKPQTLSLGRDVISKLALRSLVRTIRGVLLRDEQKYQTDKQESLVKDAKPSPQGEERELVGSGLRRSVNGRSW